MKQMTRQEVVESSLFLFDWTLARLTGEIEAREGVAISRSRLSKVLRKKKFRSRRTRHTLKCISRNSI